MEQLKKIAERHSAYLKRYHKYKMIEWSMFDFSLLTNNIMFYKKKGKYKQGTYNDVIIGADTETSKRPDDTNSSKDPKENHICAWTISIRAYHINIVTLYGLKPSDFILCLKELRRSLKGDDIYIYFHNMPYDYVFLRKFLFLAFGFPKKQLNVKPHFPINIQFENGIILKDSYILSNCKLEKWADDLNVEHKKAVGFWDYDIIRNQDHIFSNEELIYIEQDTLALVECIDSFIVSLNKTIYSIPFTATGIPRGEVREEGSKHKAHDLFVRNSLDFEQNAKIEKLYHGGYCHANRYFIDDLLGSSGDILGEDFASSYPFCMLAFTYPGKFIPLDGTYDVDFIIRNSEKYAYIFKLSLFNVRLKDDLLPMPPLQESKCNNSINMKTDNGRVTSAGYVNIYLTEQDLIVINDYYIWDQAACTEVEVSKKQYLPRWFTDYVYELFKAKCELKPLKKKDPVGYALAKAKVNSLYGLTVQKVVQRNVIEVFEEGEYQCNEHGDKRIYYPGEYRLDWDQDMKKEYEKAIKRPTSVLGYQIGVYVTAYAFRNIYRLGSGCINSYYRKDGKLAYPPHWYYTDTDSCYSDDWNQKKIKEFNEWAKSQLLKNNYGPVIVDGKEYWLGVAEHDPKEDRYTEFKVLGSKRYAGRNKTDKQIHITVAGVPKKGYLCLKDDLNKFTKDFIFDGKTTGKLHHAYIINDIHMDEFGNEIGDSINLTPDDYHMDMVDKWEFIENEEIMIQVFEDEPII